MIKYPPLMNLFHIIMKMKVIISIYLLDNMNNDE